MNNKSSIFTSGEATSEKTAFGVHEGNEKRFFTEKVKFSISFLLKNCNKFIPMRQPSGRKHLAVFRQI